MNWGSLGSISSKTTHWVHLPKTAPEMPSPGGLMGEGRNTHILGFAHFCFTSLFCFYNLKQQHKIFLQMPSPLGIESENCRTSSSIGPLETILPEEETGLAKGRDLQKVIQLKVTRHAGGLWNPLPRHMHYYKNNCSTVNPTGHGLLLKVCPEIIPRKKKKQLKVC